MQSTHQETHFQATIHAYGVSSSNSFFDSLRKQQFDFVDTTHIFSRVCLELVPVFDAFVLCAVEYVCDLIQKCVDVKFITNLILSSPPSFWVGSLIIQLLQYCNGKESNFGINYIGQYESGINIAITCLLFPLIAYLSCVYVILNIRHEIYELWTSFILDDKIQLFEIREIFNAMA